LTGSKTVAKIPITPKTLKTRFELADRPIIYKDFCIILCEWCGWDTMI
jgi:hypothetical protein